MQEAPIEMAASGFDFQTFLILEKTNIFSVKKLKGIAIQNKLITQIKLHSITWGSKILLQGVKGVLIFCFRWSTFRDKSTALTQLLLKPHWPFLNSNIRKRHRTTIFLPDILLRHSKPWWQVIPAVAKGTLIKKAMVYSSKQQREAAAWGEGKLQSEKQKMVRLLLQTHSLKRKKG